MDWIKYSTFLFGLYLTTITCMRFDIAVIYKAKKIGTCLSSENIKLLVNCGFMMPTVYLKLYKMKNNTIPQIAGHCETNYSINLICRFGCKIEE